MGLSLTAIYNNYYYILSAVITMLSVVSASLIGGIGNHVATRSKDENFNELKRVDFFISFPCRMVFHMSHMFIPTVHENMDGWANDAS